LKSGFTPLLFAARDGKPEAVRVLLKAGVSPSEAIETKARGRGMARDGTSALLLAVENGHFELAMELVRAGADPNDLRSGFAPLHALTWVRKPHRGDGEDGQPAPRGSGALTSLAFVREIAKAGADVNFALAKGESGGAKLGMTGATPFLLAARRADVPYMKLLVELGADPLRPNAEGTTPLMTAAGLGTLFPTEEAGTEEESLEAVLYCLSKGADLNVVDRNGDTAMHGAAYKSLPKMVRLLAERGAKAEVWNRKNRHGWTPLLIAEGFRPGNFKPAPEVVAAIHDAMRAAGLTPPPPTPRPDPANSRRGYDGDGGGGARVPAPGHWPRWRGPNHDGISTETGLLKQWPEGGPPLLWKATGLGDGMSPVSVAGGIIFTVGYRGDHEVVSALDGAGKLVWSQSIGPSGGEVPGMRFLQQRAPTIDDDRLYVVTAPGVLHCLRSADGALVWKKDYARDFGGRTSGWKYGDRPIVDGDRLICMPGGAQGTVRALNKFTGADVWRTALLKDAAQFAPLVPATIGGLPQYVSFTLESVAGIDARNGALLWRAPRPGRTVVVPPPLIQAGLVFVASGHGVGCTAFQVEQAEGRFAAKEVYAAPVPEQQHGGLVLVGDHVYGVDVRSLKCVELKTGKVVWQDRSIGQAAVAGAEGRLVLRGVSGTVALVEATPEGYREKGRFVQPDRSQEYAFSHPVIAGGRLYLRDLDALFCYDLRGADFREPAPVWNILGRASERPAASPAGRSPGPKPDAVFIPTPEDVVAKMLELAVVGKDDVVYDLGSGDGRILIAAAKRYGCRAVGYEIDPNLVQESRAKAKEAGLEDRVKVEAADLFSADLAPASVVTLYLGEANNRRLVPQLRKLKAGARIVSHAHDLGIPGLKPEKTVRMMSREDGVEHVVHLWTAPLPQGGD
jgi:ankyrin repeat protein/outer membrane protein assembly factor BamB